MTQAQERNHDNDLRVVAERLVSEVNRRGWGHLVEGIWAKLNDGLTKKMPVPVRQDKVTSVIRISWNAPAESANWSSQSGTRWVNSKIDELNPVLVAQGLTPLDHVDRYGWDLITGQYVLPAVEAPAETPVKEGE